LTEITGQPPRQISFHGSLDVAKLRLAIGMVLPLLGLPVALQAVVPIVENQRHFGVTDGMLASGQGLGNGTRALARPAQWRFGITSRLLIDHRFPHAHQPRVGAVSQLAISAVRKDHRNSPAF
jgi:hypothetical protein